MKFKFKAELLRDFRTGYIKHELESSLISHSSKHQGSSLQLEILIMPVKGFQWQSFLPVQIVLFHKQTALDGFQN